MARMMHTGRSTPKCIESPWRKQLEEDRKIKRFSSLFQHNEVKMNKGGECRNDPGQSFPRVLNFSIKARSSLKDSITKLQKQFDNNNFVSKGGPRLDDEDEGEVAVKASKYLFIKTYFKITLKSKHFKIIIIFTHNCSLPTFEGSDAAVMITMIRGSPEEKKTKDMFIIVML